MIPKILLVLCVLVVSSLEKSILISNVQKITALNFGGSGLVKDVSDTLAQVFTNNRAKTYKMTYTATEHSSLTGMQDAIDGNIDIAASELPLTQQQIDDTYDIMYLPFAASALAITYHVDEVKTLTLDMPTLIGIFNGTIRYWDDSAIKATNGASATLLPHQPIVRVVRAGTSGAVYILTSAFSAVSDTWKSIYGTTASVAWPDSNSTVTSTSSGLATKIAVTPYSIGFGDVQSLKDSPIAKLVNAAGQAVTPNVASIESAATDFSLDFENRTVDIVNGIAPTSYPICMYSYLVYRGLNMSDCDKALGVYTFLTDLYSESSSFDALIQLKNSAPLDPVAKAKMLLRVRKMQCNTKVFYSEPVDNTPVTIAGITVAVVIGALVAVTIICIVVGYFWYQNYKIKKLLNHIDEGPSGFVTLFFSDIQNSTATWDACGDDMEIAIGLHNELMRATITKYGGYEVKTEGDSFFVSFKDPAAAILCCSEIHISLMYVDWPESILQVSTSKEIRDPETGDLLFRGLRVRIGLHIGIPNAKLDPTTKRTDYFGTPVNTAARCSDQCPGAVTYITKDMYDFLSAYVGDVELEYPFCKSVGMFTFQGLSEQQQLYIILPNCLAGRSSRTIKNAKHDKEKENSGHAKRLSIVEQV